MQISYFFYLLPLFYVEIVVNIFQKKVKKKKRRNHMHFKVIYAIY